MNNQQDQGLTSTGCDVNEPTYNGCIMANYGNCGCHNSARGGLPAFNITVLRDAPANPAPAFNLHDVILHPYVSRPGSTINPMPPGDSQAQRRRQNQIGADFIAYLCGRWADDIPTCAHVGN